MELNNSGKFGGFVERSKTLVSAVVAVTLFIGPNVVLSASVDDLNAQLQQNNTQADNLRNEVQAHQHAAATIAEQLAAMNAEIAEVQAQMASTRAAIAANDAQIADLMAKIAVKQQILQDYIRNQYYDPQPTTFEVLVSSDDLSSFVQRKEYLDAAQSKVQQLIAEVLAAKQALDVKKAELGKLSDQLTTQQQGLDAQRAAKNELLAQTQGEQAKYQQMLDNAEAASARLSNSIAKLMGYSNLASQGFVHRGDVIGREGSTGFSTGAHTHFGTYQNQAAVNPYQFINSGRVGWPLTGFTITQGYGPAGWSNSHYTFHDGIDMDAGYGAPILAACSGNIIINGWQPDGFGHYIVIDCGGGIWALTGHMIR